MGCTKSTKPGLATDSGAELLHRDQDSCQVLVQKLYTQNDIFHLCKCHKIIFIKMIINVIKFDQFIPLSLISFSQACHFVKFELKITQWKGKIAHFGQKYFT